MPDAMSAGSALLQRVSIREALTAYFVALQERDWDAVERTFTADAYVDYGTPGARDVRQNVGLLRAGVEKNTSVSTLLGMEPVIALCAHGARTRTVAFTAHLPPQWPDAGVKARMSAVRYEDRWLRHESGAWLICSRVCHHEFKGWLPPAH
jgi:SnoaL-like domain